MPFDEQGKYCYQGGKTISGFLWVISPATKDNPPLPKVNILGNDEDYGYVVFTEDEEPPDVGPQWMMEPLGGGLINKDAFYKRIGKGLSVKNIYPLSNDPDAVEALYRILARPK